MFPIWLASVAQGLAQKEQQAQAEEEAKKQAAARISGQFSSSMGMPSYGLEAAQTMHGIEQSREQGPAGMDFLKMYMNSQKK